MIIGPTPSFSRVHRFKGVLNFMALGDFSGRPDVYLSEDGRDWFVLPFPAPAGVSILGYISYVDGAFWIACGTGFLRTTDGREWDYIAQATGSGYLTHLIKMGAIFAALGEGNPRMWRGTEVGSLTPITADGFGGDPVFGASSGSVGAILFPDRTIKTTADGIALTSRTSNLGASGSAQFMRYLPDAARFVAGVSSGQIATAPSNGTSWTAQATGISNARDLGGGGGNYIIGGSGGQMRRSSDLINWSSVPAVEGFTGNVDRVVFRDGRILVSSVSGQMVETEDGDTFDVISFPGDRCYSLTARPD